MEQETHATGATFEIGQMLFVVKYRRTDHEELPITKIGRKWLTIGDSWQAMQVDRNTLMIDGGSYSSPGRCYRSKDEWLTEQARTAEWDKFRREIDKERSVPDGLTVETIRHARAMLLYGVAPTA